MFLLVVLLIVIAAVLGAYLVDQYDRKNGHKIGSGPEFRARIRAAKKQSRDRTWGRYGLGRGSRPGRGKPRGRRSP
ncbi:MAG: hypothetical protein M3070_14080 [Actinomycetota bacterium]|nr:hypothetical protein [Actinomycetota bacterium]